MIDQPQKKWSAVVGACKVCGAGVRLLDRDDTLLWDKAKICRIHVGLEPYNIENDIGKVQATRQP